MAQSRTSLASQVPAEFDRGVMVRILSQQDRENTRVTSFAGVVTWNPDNVADGDSTTTTVVVPGVVADIKAHVRVFPPYSLQGMIAGGYVSADDQVTIVLNNNSGLAVNLASGVWGVVVESFLLT